MTPSITACPSLHPGRAIADFARAWTRVRRARLPVLLRAGPTSCPLEKDDSRVLTHFQGGSIQCLKGCVWLTHDGDCRDVLLESGQSHVADRDSRLVIHALAWSVIRVTHTE